MFGHDDKNGFFGGELDLGSDMNAFDSFENILESGIFGKTETDAAEKKQENTAGSEQTDAPEEQKTNEKAETKTEDKNDENEHNTQAEPEAKQTEQPADSSEAAEEPNPFDAAIAEAEKKQAQEAKSSLIEKLLVFSYANAEEEIVDTSKTFDQLRNEKAEDFPELDDGTSVTWKMVYGTVTKIVSTPKKTTIAAMKKQIEDSKDFEKALKKAKGELVCKAVPSVAAKKKGVISPYKVLK